MKRLLLAFALLYSSATYADVGDVYYCVTDNLTNVKESGNKQLPEEKFKFKWTETEIVFSGGYLNNLRLNLIENNFYTENWSAGGPKAYAYFKDGKLTFSHNIGEISAIVALLATCEKF